MKYSGHIVSSNGKEPDPNKLEKVVNWHSNADEVQHFRRFIGYYRAYVKDFSKRARPLTDLMQSIITKRGKKKMKSHTKEWYWNKEQEL